MKIIISGVMVIVIGFIFIFLNESDSKMEFKVLKEIDKDLDINDKILRSQVSPLYCIDTKTNIVKYYEQNTLKYYGYQIRNWKCFDIDEWEKAQKKIYNIYLKDKE